jgi:hypothetical protein
MCHPGHVDDTLISLDPFTHQREREHAYLGGDRFPALLAAHNVTLTPRPSKSPPTVVLSHTQI